jgi:hypothetical protein
VEGFVVLGTGWFVVMVVVVMLGMEEEGEEGVGMLAGAVVEEDVDWGCLGWDISFRCLWIDSALDKRGKFSSIDCFVFILRVLVSRSEVWYDLVLIRY